MRRVVILLLLAISLLCIGASLYPFTSTFMRTVLDDPDAATARATLGVGAGDGDMLKATYDVSADGFVDGNDVIYSAAWNGDVNAPSMNAVYDKIETLGGSGDMTKAIYDVSADGFVDGNDVAYAAAWNGDVNAPSMNAVYDKIEGDVILSTEIDLFSELDAIVADKSLVNLTDGAVWLGVHNYGGADTLEVPNAAGDVTLAVIGQVAVDSTQKQLVVYDGVEKVVPLVHSMQFHGDLAGAWDVDAEWQLLDMDRGAGTFPDGIVILSWYVDCSVADPTTELNANLYYCDALVDGAFPGGGATLVDVLDTTTGNSSETDMSNSDLTSGVIPTAKILYILMDADPADATTVWSIIINYYIPES